MSRIDDLLDKLCPNGVPFKALGDVGELVRGNGLPKADFTDSGVGAIHYGQIYTFYDTWTTDTISHVASSTAAKLVKVHPGDVIITNTSENLDDVGKAVAWLGSEPIVTGGHATVLRHHENPKYIAYWLQSPAFHSQKRKLASGTKVIDVSAKSLAKIRIPLPPRELQREIVQALDLFTMLEGELKSELMARRTQYAYYCDYLFSFGDGRGVVWRPMSEVGTFTRGRRITKADVVPEGLASIHYGEIYTGYGVWADQPLSRVRPEMASSLRFAKTGDVIIAGVGETVEDVAKAVAWLGTEDVAFHDDCWAFRSSLNPKFVSYYLQTRRFHAEKKKYVARAKVKRISGTGLGKVVIPVPDRDEQDRIVAILDKFDVLANARSIGLPAEITLRRAQYEHYRDHLMTFSEAAL